MRWPQWFVYWRLRNADAWVWACQQAMHQAIDEGDTAVELIQEQHLNKWIIRRRKWKARRA